MTAPIKSEPIWAKEYADNPKTAWFYIPNIDHKLTPATRHLLETYSNIPPDEVLSHVHTIRDKAWSIRSHMCTGQGLFLSPMIPRHPLYRTILSRLSAGATIIDIGTFIGQDLRRLVFDGAPSNNMYALDIISHWDIGFSMFRDREKFHAHYIDADILNLDLESNDEEMRGLKGKMDIIWINYVLHQWVWEGQVRAAKSLVELSRVGTWVVGYSVGADEARLEPPTEKMKEPSFLHDAGSFERMWVQVGEETGSKWRTEARLQTWEELGWGEEDVRLLGPKRVLMFTVERIE